MKNLDSIKPLMSINRYKAEHLTDRKENVKVFVEYGTQKKPKTFSAIVTKDEWNKFLKKYNKCQELFWEM